MKSNKQSYDLNYKKILRTIGMVVLWLIVMLFFLRFITNAESNRFAILLDGFQGDKNCVNADCSLMTAVGYKSDGFPLLIPGHATSGPYGLASAVNNLFAGITGLLYALLLVKRRRAGIWLGSIFLLLMLGSYYFL